MLAAIGVEAGRLELLGRQIVADQQRPVPDRHRPALRQADDLDHERVPVRVGRGRDAERGGCGIVRHRDRWRRARHRRPVRGQRVEVDRLGTEGAEIVGLLPPVGGLVDPVAHPAEEEAQLEPRHLQLLEQRLGVGAVLAAAVLGDRVGPRRRGDDDIGRGVVDPAQAGVLPAAGR